MATIKQIKVGSTTYDIKNSPEFIVGTWTAASGTWTGVSSDIALYDGKEIVLYLPFAGSGNATLNLTLADGGTTGAKNVYYQSTTRMTTHYGQYSQVHLIYHSALNINGTNYEGWWSLPGRDTNTNTLLRTYASATNIEVPLIGSSSANSTTAAWSTYTSTYKDWYGAIPNDDAKRAKINLSTGALTVPGGITANLTGVASKATAANLTTTANAIVYYTNTTGTFGTKASANGALYSTGTNSALVFGTLPIAQGGTGKTTAADAWTALGGGAIGKKASLEASDIPDLNTSKLTAGTLGVARGGTGTASFTANSVVISGSTATAALTTRTISNLTTVNNLGWSSATGNGTYIPTVNTLAYWNGRYNSSSSNLAYCNQGAFGTGAIRTIPGNISYGTETPSGGSNGDIYVQYS